MWKIGSRYKDQNGDVWVILCFVGDVDPESKRYVQCCRQEEVELLQPIKILFNNSGDSLDGSIKLMELIRRSPY